MILISHQKSLKSIFDAKSDIFNLFPFLLIYWFMYITIHSQLALMILIIAIYLLFFLFICHKICNIFWFHWICAGNSTGNNSRNTNQIVLDFFKTINILEQISNFYFHSADKTAGRLNSISLSVRTETVYT